MEALKVLFFSCLFLTAYSYVVYPALLAIIASLASRRVRAGESWPKATVIISAYNEEGIIAEKISNTLALDYPKDRLEVIIASDGSTDRTDTIVRSFEKEGVILMQAGVRRGKTPCLNDAVTKATGEIIVFSDADSMYDSGALRKMAEYLNDPQVGLVTGSTMYVSESDGAMVATSGIYTRLERAIKRYESAIGSCVGADGAIFAVKKALYKPLRSDDINDLVIPLNVVRQGYRVVINDGVFCREASAKGPDDEFRRQTRITNRTLRAIFRNADLLNFFRYPAFSFELFSHKIIRLGAPFFMAALLPLNMLLFGEGWLYKAFLAGQALFYSGALAGMVLEKKGRSSGLGFIYHFVMVNLSMLFGWLKFLAGEKQVMWQPPRQ